MTKVTISSQGNFRASVNKQGQSSVRTVSVIPTVPTNYIMNLTDVDSTGLSNNDTLVYNSATGKFETKSIESVVGGSF